MEGHARTGPVRLLCGATALPAVSDAEDWCLRLQHWPDSNSRTVCKADSENAPTPTDPMDMAGPACLDCFLLEGSRSDVQRALYENF